MSRFQRHLLPAVALLCLPLSLPAFADTVVVVQSNPVYEAPRWGIGLVLGTPTGLSLKRYLGRNAFDVYLGGVYGPGMRFGADYLWGLAQLVRAQSVNLDFYVGLGGFVGALRGPCGSFYNWQGTCNGDGYVGARVPIGLEFVFKSAPISLGLELAPGIAFAPDRQGFLFDGNLALRFLL